MESKSQANILFIENNHDLGGSWKKVVELLFPITVDAVISVREAKEAIANSKYSMIFIHLPNPEVRSKLMVEHIRTLEEHFKLEPVPTYIFVSCYIEDDAVSRLNQLCSGVLLGDNMIYDAGICLKRDLGIEPKSKDLLEVIKQKMDEQESNK